MPHLKELYGRYKSQGLVLIGLHSDKGEPQMKAAVKELGMTWPIGMDAEGKTLASLKDNGFPTYCLVDRKGILRVNDIDPSDLEKAIKALLKEKS